MVAAAPVVTGGPPGALGASLFLLGLLVGPFLALTCWERYVGRRRGVAFSAACPAIDFRLHRRCAVTAGGFWVTVERR